MYGVVPAPVYPTLYGRVYPVFEAKWTKTPNCTEV